MASRDLKVTLVGEDKTSGAFGSAGGGAAKFGAMAVAAFAAFATAAIGTGVALFKIGSEFDKSYDTIRVGTGATGKVLDGLKDDFRAVVKDVPTDFASASTAIADLNTRTGQTGEPLRQLSKQMLEMTRLTGGDLTANVASVTRVFGDWGISMDKQSDTMDYLFKVSQTTGIGVDALSSKVVQFGAPLRQLGFDFETSAAMLGKWEKEGVNTEAVLAGMKIGLGKFSKAGKDPVEAMRAVSEAIKGAGTAGEANMIAIEAFGQRAGPDMAAAVREGRFDLDALMATLKGSKETILGAAADTQSFGEKWTMFKNNVLLALEPVAARVFTAMGVYMDKFSVWWTTNGPAIITTASAIGAGITAAFTTVGAAIASVVSFLVGQFSAWWTTNGPAVTAAAQTMAAGVVAAFQAVGAVVTATVAFFREHETAARALGTVVAAVATAVAAAWVAQAAVATVNAAKSVLAWLATATASTTSATIQSKSTAQIVVGWVAAAAGATVNAAKVVARWVATGVAAVAASAVHTAQVAAQVAKWVVLATAGAAVNAARIVASWVVTSAGAIAAGAVMIAQTAVQVAKWAFLGAQSLFHAAKVAAAWLIAMGPIGLVIAAVVGVVALIVANWDTIRAKTEQLWNAVKAATGAAWAAIKGTISGALDAIKGAVQGGFDAVRGVVQASMSAVQGVVSGAWNAIRGVVANAVGAVIGAIGGLGQIPGRVGGFFNSAKDAAGGALNGLVGLVASIPGRVLGALGNLGSLLVNAGKSIVEGLLSGIRSMAGAVKDVLLGLLPGPLKKFAGALGISSPSKVFAEFGRNIGQGLAGGIDSTRSMVAGSVTDLADLADLAGLKVGGASFANARLSATASRAPVESARLSSGSATDALLAELIEEVRALHGSTKALPRDMQLRRRQNGG